MPAGPSNSNDEDLPVRPGPQGDARLRSDRSQVTESADARGADRGALETRPNDIELLLRQAQEALATIDGPDEGLPAGAHPLELQDFAAGSPHGELDVVDAHFAGEVELTVELGRVRLRIEDVLALRKGAVVPLEPLVGAPVDVFAKGRLVARGDVLVLDGRFCVRVTETFTGDVAG